MEIEARIARGEVTVSDWAEFETEFNRIDRIFIR
jgi:hypothetical protein